MNKNTKVIALVAVLLVIGAGAFALTSMSRDKNTKQPAQVTPPRSDAPEGYIAEPAPNTIYYTVSGFSAANFTLKSGGKITFKNETTGAIEINSEPHPQHTDNQELNVGSIAPGQSKTITLNKKGASIYHNHLKPKDAAVLIVE